MAMILPLCSFTLGRSAVNATNSHLVHLARYGVSNSGRKGPGSSHWRAASVARITGMRWRRLYALHMAGKLHRNAEHRTEKQHMTAIDTKIRINRAPMLTLWAAVVAERLGFDHSFALTLGQAVAGLSAYAKGVSLGILEPRPDLIRERGDRLGEGEGMVVDLLGRAVPVVRTRGQQGQAGQPGQRREVPRLQVRRPPRGSPGGYGGSGGRL